MKSEPLRVGPGILLSQYSPDEAAQVATRWLEAFGRDSEGIDAEAFLWYIFSSGRYPSESGASAKTHYEERVAHEYVFLSNDRKVALTTDRRPDNCSLSDYHVFPRNLAWTMAFTHEDGWLGPYFARHRDFAKLELENAARVRKEREAEVARLKGWR